MAQANEELLYNEAFCARVKALRTEKYGSAEQMAILLGIPPDRYRKYENRSPMPPYLVERFAALVDADVQYVLTGRPYKAPPLGKAARAARKRA